MNAFKSISWLEGLKAGLRTAWMLGKVVFPVTLVVTVLQYTAVYEALISLIEPAMGWFGLPGEAAVPLVLGNLLNTYAAVAAILTMELSVKQVFILAVMINFSHMLPVESAVCRRIGASATLVTLVRLTLALAAGLVLNLVWSGGGQPAEFAVAAPGDSAPSGWVGILGDGLQSAASGLLQLALIVIPVMMFIQILKDLKVLDWFAARMRPLMRPLGLPDRGSVTMASGLLFGLAFGAGVIMGQAREQKFSRRELTLIVLFLSACHAIIEDTLVFVPLGVDVVPLVAIRVTVAVALTLAIALLWKPEPDTTPAPSRR